MNTEACERGTLCLPTSVRRILLTGKRSHKCRSGTRKKIHKKAKQMQKTGENKAEVVNKHAKLHSFAFLLALPFVFSCFAFALTVTHIFAPCIYGWRAGHNPTTSSIINMLPLGFTEVHSGNLLTTCQPVAEMPSGRSSMIRSMPVPSACRARLGFVQNTGVSDISRVRLLTPCLN